jgi:signal transduction histidine kinase
MYQLIEDMLAYSRIERRSPSLVSLDLGIAIAEVLAEISPSLTLVELSLDIHSGSVLGDKEALAVALRNLIDNAIKFSHLRKPPRVEIHSHLHGDKHILAVRDNGTGFSMKHHDSIFKIFHRLHRAEDFPGTGVGLALVKKAMERMNGRVWAESEQDNGAEFFLEFQQP